MAKYDIFRLHRNIDESGVATLEVIPKQSDNNPQFVYKGFVNNAKISIVNQGDRVLLFFSPLGKKYGKVHPYSRAVVEVDGTPEEIADKINTLSKDAFNETWYNPTSRQASYDYYLARKEMDEEKKESNKKNGGSFKMSKDSKEALKKRIAELEKGIKAAKKS